MSWYFWNQNGNSGQPFFQTFTSFTNPDGTVTTNYQSNFPSNEINNNFVPDHNNFPSNNDDSYLDEDTELQRAIAASLEGNNETTDNTPTYESYLNAYKEEQPLHKDNLIDEQNKEFEKSLEIDKRKEMKKINDEDEKLLLEIRRSSMKELTLPEPDLTNKNECCEITTQIPHSQKRVKRTFNWDDTWETVKNWVCLEMANDDKIPAENIVWPEDFELALNYPFTLLTSVDKSRKLLNDRDLLKTSRILVQVHIL